MKTGQKISNKKQREIAHFQQRSKHGINFYSRQEQEAHTNLHLPSSGHSTSPWGDKTWRRRVDIKKMNKELKKKKKRETTKKLEKGRDRIHAK